MSAPGYDSNDEYTYLLMPEHLDKTEGGIAAFLLSVGFSTDPDPPAMTNQAPELDELEEKIGEILDFGGIPYPFFSAAITTQAPGA